MSTSNPAQSLNNNTDIRSNGFRSHKLYNDHSDPNRPNQLKLPLKKEASLDEACSYFEESDEYLRNSKRIKLICY